MDAYPEDYIAHNLPLILLSGLEADNKDDARKPEEEYPQLLAKGPQIYSDIPQIGGQIADRLRRAFMEEDASHAPWNSRSYSRRPGGIGFKLKTIGRYYRLPSRKADPPPISPSSSSGRDGPPVTRILHSPISPLTPDSPTFPDSILTPLWVTKHQNIIPAATVNFFPLTSDGSMISLCDNQLKIEINSLKNTWVSSGYRARFLVVLVPEDGVSLEDVDNRLAGIRRAANLDPRFTFVIFPNSSSSDLEGFAASLLSSLQPPIVEYYRDLSKHARRKRNRGSVPPPTAPPTTGTSHTLSSQGWNVRYEFKLGIFAEFRQEMEAAFRNYESAYEILFEHGVFESIAGWNAKFNDARLLADCLAIRIIRCLLWSGQTTAAVRSWLNHRNRTQDILNRRGKGTKSYGWAAWEARWSMVMADLIQRAQLPHFTDKIDSPLKSNESLFIPSERNIPVGENVMPWELLHHEGYWLDRSAKYSVLRRTLASHIPDEDRIPASKSLAFQAQSNLYLYDTYLVLAPYDEAPHPGRAVVNHSKLVLETLKASLAQFSRRQQNRKVEQLSLEIAKEYVRIDSWPEAYKVLKPLWPRLTWRSAGWWELMEDFAWTLRECALRSQDNETVIRVDWELLNQVFSPRPGWKYDLHQSLGALQEDKPKPVAVLKAEDVVSCLSASLIFEKPEGNVGEPLRAQLLIESVAQPGSAPITISEVKIGFEGSLRPITLLSDHDTSEDGLSLHQVLRVPLHDSSTSADSSILLSPTGSMASMVGRANLTFAPFQIKAFNLTCIPREAGEAKVGSITILVEGENFDIVYAIIDHRRREYYWWLDTEKGAFRKRIGKDRDTLVCKILPKPPKIRITTPNLRDTYYTNERVVLDVDIYNEEDEAAKVTTCIRLLGQRGSAIQLSWVDIINANSADSEFEDQLPPGPLPYSLLRTIDTLESSANARLSIKLSDTNDALDYELEISVLYYLVSDIETPISKTLTVDLPFIRPFEANYELLPRVDPKPWPNFFSIDNHQGEDGLEAKPKGLQQKWCVNSKLVSFALEPLIIENLSLIIRDTHSVALCHISPETLVSPPARHILPEELRESEFALHLQKADLEDRQPVSLDLALDVEWRRPGAETLASSDAITTSSLAMPHLVIPIGEPRVLASATASEIPPGMIHMNYTIENPSLHFLTFNLTMEASEHFAFSGPKTTVIQLVPLSRHIVRYHLLAFKRGIWIQPQLIVVDTYFNKTLRVLPTEGMRTDKKGIQVWVDAEG